MLAVQRMRPDVLLQRPPVRESLKVAAGVSRGERGAGAPRGRRGEARVLCALPKTGWRVPHRPVQAGGESAHCRGADREVRELSTAASTERGRVCCRSACCGLDCADSQWDLGGLKFSPSLFPVLQLHPQRWLCPEKLKSTLRLIQYPHPRYGY